MVCWFPWNFTLKGSNISGQASFGKTPFFNFFQRVNNDIFQTDCSMWYVRVLSFWICRPISTLLNGLADLGFKKNCDKTHKKISSNRFFIACQCVNRITVLDMRGHFCQLEEKYIFFFSFKLIPRLIIKTLKIWDSGASEPVFDYLNTNFQTSTGGTFPFTNRRTQIETFFY